MEPYRHLLGAVRAALALQGEHGAAVLIVGAWAPGSEEAVYRIYQGDAIRAAQIVADCGPEHFTAIAGEIGTDGGFYDDCPNAYGPYLVDLDDAGFIERAAIALRSVAFAPGGGQDAVLNYDKQRRMFEAEAERRGKPGLLARAEALVPPIAVLT